MGGETGSVRAVLRVLVCPCVLVRARASVCVRVRVWGPRVVSGVGEGDRYRRMRGARIWGSPFPILFSTMLWLFGSASDGDAPESEAQSERPPAIESASINGLSVWRMPWSSAGGTPTALPELGE